MSYRIYTVDLTAKQDRAEVVPPGLTITQVEVLDVPAGQLAALAFGVGEPIPFLRNGLTFNACPPETGGLYVQVPAGQAGTLTLYVSFGGPTVGNG